MTKFASLDGSDWHMSGIEETALDSCFQEVVMSEEQISQRGKKALIENGKQELTLLQNGGREWLIAPLKASQPKSYSVLERYSSELRVGLEWYSQVPAPWAPKDQLNVQAFLAVNGRLVFIKPPRSGKPCYGVLSSDCLPDVITQSWLKNAVGWGIYTLPCPWSESRQLITHPHAFWPSIENVLFSFDPQWADTKDMEHIKNKVPSVFVTHHNSHDGFTYEWCSMRCFLDTRPFSLNGRCGDQFFVIDSHTDKVVYHIHDGDTQNIRILEADGIGEAMDDYCAHTLMRTPGRFDFMPWSRLA